METKNNIMPIQNERELEFAVFCIESIAQKINKPSDIVYKALAENRIF